LVNSCFYDKSISILQTPFRVMSMDDMLNGMAAILTRLPRFKFHSGIGTYEINCAALV